MSATLDLSGEQGQAFWRAAEAAQAVHDRYQFFVWLRLHLHRFIPHDLALCQFPGPAPTRETVPVHLFYSVPLSAPLLDDLPKSQSRWWAQVADHWQRRGRTGSALTLGELPDTAETQALRQDGFSALLVHGLDAVAGMPRAALFAFALRAEDTRHAPVLCSQLNLWLPTLYCTAMRALAPRVDDSAAATVSDAEGEPRMRTGGESVLTGRELQILTAVRDARHNAEIGDQLGISPLTVKNHLRKIMRKLQARNRAQAVAEAMARRLIS